MSVVVTSVPAVPGTVPPETRAYFDRIKNLYDRTNNSPDDIKREFAAALFRCDKYAAWGLAKIAEQRGDVPTVVSVYLGLYQLPSVTAANPDTVFEEAGYSQINLRVGQVGARM